MPSSRWVPFPKRPIYIPGRLRICSNALSVWIFDSSYVVIAMGKVYQISPAMAKPKNRVSFPFRPFSLWWILVTLFKNGKAIPIPWNAPWMDALYPKMLERRPSLSLYPDPVQRSCLSRPLPNKPLEGRGLSEQAFHPLFGLLTTSNPKPVRKL